MSTAVSTRLRVTAIVALIAFSMAVMVPTAALADPSTPQATKAAHGLSAFVQSAPTSTAAGVTGLLNITNFSVVNNVLMANGVLYGNIIQADGTLVPLGAAGQSVSIPVSSVDPSCTILTLTLGPLDLNVLGLMVHLSTVNLVVTAQQGAGNLLGNLLCAVANLLNNFSLGGTLTSLLNQLSGILNQIVGVLAGL